MNCIIVDDNKIARATLVHLAKQIPDLKVIAECVSAFEAFTIIQEKDIDLVLLDIQMPGTTGIDLVKNLGQKKPIIIFITSKKEFAIDAFELSVADYLLKPVTPLRFAKAIEKAREIINATNVKMEDHNDEYLFIREGNIVKKIKIDTILFGEAMGDYVKIFTEDSHRYFTIHNTLKIVEERLPENKFIRVHRSYFVAINKIDTLRDGGIVFGEKIVPVADSYRSALNNRLRVL